MLPTKVPSRLLPLTAASLTSHLRRPRGRIYLCKYWRGASTIQTHCVSDQPRFGAETPGCHNTFTRLLQHTAAGSRACSYKTSSHQIGHVHTTVEAIKAELLAEIDGTDRGIAGVQAEKKRTICDLIARLEEAQPAVGITSELSRLEGNWKLVFSTIAITGKRRTKLGLRQFIRLGDFTQSIDLDQTLATNKVEFSVTGVGVFRGNLTIQASFQVVGPQRVKIEFDKATLEPRQLQALFDQNYDLLLSIFNPAGWLDITFVDGRHRTGRDDKGNVFLLERL